MAVGSSACWRRAILKTFPIPVSVADQWAGPRWAADGKVITYIVTKEKHLEYLGATTNWGTSQATDRFQPGANLCLRLVPRREEPRFSARCEREECRLDEELQTELSDHSPGGFVQRPRRVSYVPHAVTS